ncbi:MAG: hypothetical protein AAF063_14030 [Cyanobacteria bacterium J06643_5]
MSTEKQVKFRTINAQCWRNPTPVCLLELEVTPNTEMKPELDLILDEMSFKILDHRYHPEFWKCSEGKHRIAVPPK